MAIEKNIEVVEVVPYGWESAISLWVIDGHQSLSVDEAKQLRKELKAAIKIVEGKA